MSNQLNAGAGMPQGNNQAINPGSKHASAGELGALVTDATNVLKNLGTQQLDSAKTTLANAQNMVTDSARQYAGATDEYVRSNPWQALGLAAAGGLLVGILLARR